VLELPRPRAASGLVFGSPTRADAKFWSLAVAPCLSEAGFTALSPNKRERRSHPPSADKQMPPSMQPFGHEPFVIQLPPGSQICGLLSTGLHCFMPCEQSVQSPFAQV
jgi:hypothetical protein